MMLSKSQQQRFKRGVQNLNALILEVRETIPDAQYYLEDGCNFYILPGPSHDDNGKDLGASQLAIERLYHADCGAW